MFWKQSAKLIGFYVNQSLSLDQGGCSLLIFFSGEEGKSFLINANWYFNENGNERKKFITRVKWCDFVPAAAPCLILCTFPSHDEFLKCWGATGRRALFHLHTRVRHQPGWAFHHPIKAVVSPVLDLCTGSWQKCSGRGGCGWRGQAVVIAHPCCGSAALVLCSLGFLYPAAGFEKSKGWEALRIRIYVVCSKLCF